MHQHKSALNESSYKSYTCVYWYDSAYEDIFFSLSAAPENILQNETARIYTTTNTHASHVIVHFYIRQHLRTILSQFKNRFHKVG